MFIIIVKDKKGQTCHLCRELIPTGSECFMIFKGYLKKHRIVQFRHFSCQYKRKRNRQDSFEKYVAKWKWKDGITKLHKYLKQKKTEANPKIVRKYLVKLEELRKIIKIEDEP